MTLARLRDESIARFGEYEALAFEGFGEHDRGQHERVAIVRHEIEGVNAELARKPVGGNAAYR